MTKKRILIVDDDRELASLLRDNLLAVGFEVEFVLDGEAAIAKAAEFAPDLVILDIMLPGGSGFDLCGRLRQAGGTPVIILSALGQKNDKLRGLGLGADDYVTKPFDLDELLARVHTILRRARPVIEELVLGRIRVNFRARQAVKGHRALHLTHKELEVLRYLAEHSHRIVYRNELLREVWGYADIPLTRCVDKTIARLRKKIEPDTHHPMFIHTVPGDGYWLTLN
jgi:two-component system response regulator VicR